MKRLLLLLAIIIVLASCSTKDAINDPEDIRRADMVLNNGTFTLYRNGENPIEFQAEELTFYRHDNRALLKSLSFRQEDASGNIIIDGSAESGELDLENEILYLNGNATLISHRDNMMIRSDDSLSFNVNTEEVEARGNIRVENEDSSFSSSVFYGNLLNMNFSFSELKEAKITI